MNKKILVISFLAATSLTVEAVNLQPPSNSAVWYYNLGGQNATSAPPSHVTNSIVLGGSADWGLGSNCGAFDPTFGIANTFNDIKSGVDSFQDQLMNAASSAISSLPLLILQRANPGLYDMLMSSLASAEARLDLSTKSCEKAMEEIGRGDNPYEDWVVVSRSRDWQTEMGGGNYRSASGDVHQAKENVERKNGRDGVPWIDGKNAGGEGQPAIRIPSDVVQAGYNQTFNRSANSMLTAPANGSRMGELWATPQDAIQFSRSVLGEEVVYTYNNRPTQTLPGRGLSFEISEEIKTLTPKFDDLIDGNRPMDVVSLNEVSAPNIFISWEVILGLRNIRSDDSEILKSRLVQEVATARVLEKALMLRRLMLSGVQEPNVYASGVGVSATGKYLEAIDGAINNVLFEAEVNKKLASVTGGQITALNDQSILKGNETSITKPRDSRLPVSGGISKSNK